ncbi:acyl-CoA synthetase [Brevibacillus fulvus]|uniref:Acetyl-CoA synthetase n=1 Tax=Brevibacillus fulvus TaxID=1125967 RepID=A0A939BQQ9_9BACL|nr:acyl--CoA ligase [Brevibacillus fulvus]MBM7588797.1 acetyl-CoA synthetase [Brevibacillus fulvus]
MELTAKEQPIQIPSEYNFAAEVDRYASAHPDKAALLIVEDSGESVTHTYGQLVNYANRIANAFTELGVTRGDTVMVLLPRGLEAYGTYLGLLKIGAIILPGSEMLRAKDIEYRIKHAGVKAVIAFPPLIPEINTVRSGCDSLRYCLVFGGADEAGWTDLNPLVDKASETFATVNTRADETAILSYTSGTTGGPKGVMHSYGWPYAHLAIAATQWLGVQESDLVWATAAPGWMKWIWSPFVSILGKGATAFVYSGRFSPTRYLKLLESFQISVLCATPTEYRMMAKVDKLEQYKLDRLRSACSAGEPLNREVIDTFRRAFNILVRDGYGQTESTLLIGTFLGMEARPGSMGRPSPLVKAAIIDEAGNPLPVGEVGDIAIDRSMIALFQGYLHDPERTARSYRGNWYVTGDQGRMDEDGYFWFEGRADDIIISSGYTIGPFEVEDALVKHPLVAEAAAVASPDPIRGHIVKAFVILKDGTTGTPELVYELQDHVKKLTAPYKYPRKIEFVDELPKTNSGKIRRIELRQKELDRS